MTKIQNNRKLKYKDLASAHFSSCEIVFSRDGDKGFIIGEAPPYIGEAGYSNRAKVLWSNGRITWCAYKGMTQVNGGWKIK